ncbi:hypothetical protein [Amycolatopsis albispora]|uniref:LamG-like jellyroll fold domain-containing protein n=1 Tax=Amycolatopsis albispora TaxID=1804986 RepID=A0A344LHB2_9PSEU|nr:hypothetical protein [Amycolatopsis albispora]AXB47436.1 hypothetical protein A4R43_37425 [Amycolatopsis albispora]
MSRRVLAGALAVLGCLSLTTPASAAPEYVLPSLKPDLVVYYDFEHPLPGNPAKEQDQGFSGTTLDLVNGGAEMRAAGGAHPASANHLTTRQVAPDTAGNDDWKAGVYSPTGVPSMRAFNAVRQTTVMGWFRMSAHNPAPNSGTPAPGDFYNAVGLAGVLSGTSDGHGVRALLELIQVDGELRVVALGRRLDSGASQTFAAQQDWRSILPPDEWVFLAATFDFGTGEMALYRNGRPLPGFYVTPGDPWELGGPGPHVSSPTDPRGIKIGGSFPQDTREANPCDCGFDSLMFLDRAVTRWEVLAQYHRAVRE